MLIASVEIDGTDKGFKGVARKVAVMRLIVLVVTDKFVKANLRVLVRKPSRFLGK